MNNKQLMKKCQTGIGNYKNAIDDANNLLAECYGILGKLETENEKLTEIVKAVAHIGVDFGYGKFEIGQDEIEKARLLIEPKT